MILLALDTGGADIATAALAFGEGEPEDGRLLVCRRETVGHGHAARLVPFLLEAAEAAGFALGAIGLIAIATGPGSFTGLRVGLATAGGLALATGAGIVGISSFEAMRATALADGGADRQPSALLVAVDGRRAEPFVQLFAADGTAGAPANPDGAALGRMLAAAPRPVALCGDGAPLVGACLAEAAPPAAGTGPASLPIVHPGPIDPVVLARLGWARRGEASSAPPAPLYVRPPDARPNAPP